MPRNIITYSMPFSSLIPAGLGVLMVLIIITVFNLLGYTQCPKWSLIQSAPVEDVQIIGASKDIVYLRSREGTIYCITQNNWSKCKVSTFAFSHTDAPLWYNTYFKFIPEEMAAVQITRAGNDYLGYSNVVLLSNGNIWVCPFGFQTEIKQLMSSGAIIWVIVPAVIWAGCVIWFLMIFAKSGSPTIWDYWGRGTKIK